MSNLMRSEIESSCAGKDITISIIKCCVLLFYCAAEIESSGIIEVLCRILQI